MDALKTGYEKVLYDYKGNRSGRIRRQVRNVLGLIDLARDEKILEVGTATGKFTSIMSKYNSVFALDLSFDNLERAKRTVGELGNRTNLWCVAGNCAATPFSGSVFDKIVAIDIIEHLADAVFDMFCQEAGRLLKREGCLYIYTPNLLHPYELARPFRPALRREHVGVRTRANINSFLRKHGFLVEKSYFNNIFRRISIKARKA